MRGKHDWNYRPEKSALTLLSEPVKLQREGKTTVVTIDRKNVTQIIISNEGKEEIFDKYVRGREKQLESKDREIHRFLVDNAIAGNPPLMDDILPLRWASGGVLSIITFRGRKWVPLFFRDIRPYGWNISLGSTERWFDANHNLHHLYDPEKEFNNPWTFLCREFLEESFVLDGDPEKVKELSFKKFCADPPFVDDTNPDDFARQHCELRNPQDQDYLQIQGGRDVPKLHATLQTANSTVKVIPRSRADPQPTQHVLVCFSLLDLGIEVVKVVEYTLEDQDYLLDGEIKINDDRTAELVRQPIALFSCDYLRKLFKKNDDWFHYTFGTAPSVEVKYPPSAANDPTRGDPAQDEVHLFTWDIIRRMAIVRGKPGSAWQHERFTKWYDMFGSHFVDREGKPTCACLPRLFVPATAKILNLYFSNVEISP